MLFKDKIADGDRRRPRARPEAAAAERLIDVPVALTVVGLGIVIIVARVPVPGFVPTM